MKLKINAENQQFTFTNITVNTKASLEESPIDIMNTIIHSQPMNSNLNETTETDSNSTLLVDGPLFSSHTVNTLSPIDLENKNKINNNNNNREVFNDTFNNTTI